LENGVTGDIGGYDGFALSLVRRVFGQLIAKELVSVQPMSAPTGKVFYLDPQVTTGTSQDYQSMYESHYNNANYDVSKGAYTLLSGTSTGITAINYNSGLSFNIAYSGGSEGLSSLRIVSNTSTYSDMVSLNGANGTCTAGAGVIPVDTTKAFDNNTMASTIALLSGELGWMKFGFTTSPTQPVKKYSMFVASTDNIASWKFCGSTDNISWSLLDNRLNETIIDAEYNYYTPTSSSIPYKYYMLTGITDSSSVLGIFEFELMGETISSENLNCVISPTTWTHDIFSGNLINVIVHQTGSTLTGTANTFTEWRDYTGLEASSGMQTIKLNVISSNVEARTRKIRGKLTEELLQDAEAYFQINAINELADLMGDEIAAEIDREIISDLINIAPFRSEWYYNMYALTGMTGFVTGNSSSEIASAVTQYRWAQDSLLTAINKMDATIKKANIYHGANWLICSAKVGTVVETMKEHKAVIGSTIMRVDKIHRTGKLKSTINVYVDPYLPDNICLLGYNGTNWDSGYIYAPYVISTPNLVRDPDTLFETNTEFLTRYATKIITNKKYGLIDCRFPTDAASKIVNEV
jgi:hypothetical protein